MAISEYSNLPELPPFKLITIAKRYTYLWPYSARMHHGRILRCRDKESAGKIMGGGKTGLVVWKESFLEKFPELRSYNVYRREMISDKYIATPRYELVFRPKEGEAFRNSMQFQQFYQAGATYVLDHMLLKTPFWSPLFKVFKHEFKAEKLLNLAYFVLTSQSLDFSQFLYFHAGTRLPYPDAMTEQDINRFLMSLSDVEICSFFRELLHNSAHSWYQRSRSSNRAHRPELTLVLDINYPEQLLPQLIKNKLTINTTSTELTVALKREVLEYQTRWQHERTHKERILRYTSTEPNRALVLFNTVSGMTYGFNTYRHDLINFDEIDEYINHSALENVVQIEQNQKRQEREQNAAHATDTSRAILHTARHGDTAGFKDPLLKEKVDRQIEAQMLLDNLGSISRLGSIMLSDRVNYELLRFTDDRQLNGQYRQLRTGLSPSELSHSDLTVLDQNSSFIKPATPIPMSVSAAAATKAAAPHTAAAAYSTTRAAAGSAGSSTSRTGSPFSDELSLFDSMNPDGLPPSLRQGSPVVSAASNSNSTDLLLVAPQRPGLMKRIRHLSQYGRNFLFLLNHSSYLSRTLLHRAENQLLDLGNYDHERNRFSLTLTLPYRFPAFDLSTVYDMAQGVSSLKLPAIKHSNIHIHITLDLNSLIKLRQESVARQEELGLREIQDDEDDVQLDNDGFEAEDTDYLSDSQAEPEDNDEEFEHSVFEPNSVSSASDELNDAPEHQIKNGFSRFIRKTRYWSPDKALKVTTHNRVTTTEDDELIDLIGDIADALELYRQDQLAASHKTSLNDIRATYLALLRRRAQSNAAAAASVAAAAATATTAAPAPVVPDVVSTTARAATSKVVAASNISASADLFDAPDDTELSTPRTEAAPKDLFEVPDDSDLNSSTARSPDLFDVPDDPLPMTAAATTAAAVADFLEAAYDELPLMNSLRPDASAPEATAATAEGGTSGGTEKQTEVNYRVPAATALRAAAARKAREEAQDKAQYQKHLSTGNLKRLKRDLLSLLHHQIVKQTGSLRIVISNHISNLNDAVYIADCLQAGEQTFDLMSFDVLKNERAALNPFACHMQPQLAQLMRGKNFILYCVLSLRLMLLTQIKNRDRDVDGLSSRNLLNIRNDTNLLKELNRITAKRCPEGLQYPILTNRERSLIEYTGCELPALETFADGTLNKGNAVRLHRSNLLS